MPLWWVYLKQSTNISIMKIIIILRDPVITALLIIFTIISIRFLTDSIISWSVFFSIIFFSVIVFISSYFLFSKVLINTSVVRFTNLIKNAIGKIYIS